MAAYLRECRFKPHNLWGGIHDINAANVQAIRYLTKILVENYSRKISALLYKTGRKEKGRLRMKAAFFLCLFLAIILYS